MSLSADLRADCQELGFSLVRAAHVERLEDAEHMARWLEAGHHGEMHYLERGLELRADPRRRMPGARTALVLGLEHAHRRPPDPGGRTGAVARYAWGRDYHNLIGKRLRKLKRRLRERGLACWGGVDTAPILERAWARRAGLGYTGRNTLQILPGRGSWMFLAVLFLDAELPPDPPLEGDFCGSCRRCLDVCPTGAFTAPYQLDARLCIAYWTIEAGGLMPRALRPRIGRWVFGCDLCQEVCPHNHDPPPCGEEDLAPRHAWLDLDRLIATPDAELMERFRGTPLRRPGAKGLKRNALVVLANLGDPAGLRSVRAALQHPAPVVRAAAVWAGDQLGDRGIIDHRDPAPLVRAELQALRDDAPEAST